MTLSGIPVVTADAPKYIQKALLPDRTDAEAVAELTRSVDGAITHFSIGKTYIIVSITFSTVTINVLKLLRSVHGISSSAVE